MTPTISVCVPTHNRSAALARTLEAILGQTEQDFEIIVGDDASTDDTSEIVRRFGEPRIRYLRHPANLGIYANWNALVAEARGRYICIYHDHDTYLPTILQRSRALIERDPAIAFVHTAFVLVDREGTPIDVFTKDFDEVMEGRGLEEIFSKTTRSRICAASTMVRREAYAAAGPFDPRYGLGADRLMWLRLAATGRIGYVSDPQVLILGRSPGDATERFDLRDLFANYDISLEALRKVWPLGSVQHWTHERQLRREVQRDLFAGLVKAVVSGTGAEIRDRADLVSQALSPLEARLARTLVRQPVSAVVRALAGRVHQRRLAARQRRAIEFVRHSDELRRHLPAAHARGAV